MMLDFGIRPRHLQCFLMLAQMRNMGRAADALSVAQPALSKTLRELEGALQVRLFHRGPRGMSLTSYGKLFLQHAAASVTSLRQGINVVRAARLGDPAALSIGVLPNVAPKIVPAALQRFHREYPSVAVSVFTGTNGRLLDQLRLGELDMVVGRLARPEQMLDATFEHLYSERLSLVVRHRHPLTALGRITPAALSGYPWILPTADTIVGHEISRYLIDRGVTPPSGIIETTVVEFARGHVRSSDAIWFCPRGAAELDIDDGMLVEIFLNKTGLTGPVGITTRAGASLPPVALAMVDSIRAVCRSGHLMADIGAAMVRGRVHSGLPRSGGRRRGVAKPRAA